MQGVRALQPCSDENAAAMHDPLRGKASLMSAKDTSLGKPPLTARKAFGNITNTKLEQSATKPATKRRALGDISNSVAKPSAAASKPQSGSKHGAANISKRVEAAGTVPAASDDARAERYALDGVERRAGKSWRTLEADRLKAEEQSIRQRANALASAAAAALCCSARLPRLEFSDEDDDQDVAVEAEPSANSRPGSAAAVADYRQPLQFPERDPLDDLPEVPELEGGLAQMQTLDIP